VNNCIKILRDAAKVGVPANKFIGNNYDFSHIIPETLGKDAESFKAIQINADWGENIPMMKEIEDMGGIWKRVPITFVTFLMATWRSPVSPASPGSSARTRSSGRPFPALTGIGCFGQWRH
jgi:hypothetical protein